MTDDDTVTLTSTSPDDDTGASTTQVTISRRLGPVKLLRQIGQGGMGVVYLGHHELLGRDVAVKFLLQAAAGTDDPEFARFLAGARAAASVKHPGLNVVHHADVLEGIPYLVMEYIEGPSLARIRDRVGPLAPAATLALLERVCQAVDELHERQIVHRDIKPSNILLDGEGRVYVTDFGLAWAKPSGGSSPPAVQPAGTRGYMAPETFDGEVSPRTDVYALGIMTFELLTGRRPFAGTPEELRAQHRDQPLPIDRLEASGVEPAVIEVIQRAAHKKPMFRYKSAGHYLRALRHAWPQDHLPAPDERELAQLLNEPQPQPAEPPKGDTGSAGSSSYFDEISRLANRKRGNCLQTLAEQAPAPSPPPSPLPADDSWPQTIAAAGLTDIVPPEQSTYGRGFLPDEVVRNLVANDRVGETIRACPAAEAFPIVPITVSFDPVPLSDAPTLLSQSQPAAAGPPGSAAADQPSDTRSLHRPTAPRKIWASPWLWAPLYTIFITYQAVMTYRQPTFNSVFVLALLIVAIGVFLLASRRSGSLAQEWLLVPGGLVLRTAGLFKPVARSRLFDRRKSVLCVYRVSAEAWTFAVADTDTCETGQATPGEINALLRAWLSPLPTPPFEPIEESQQP